MEEAEWREYRLNLPHLRMRGATYFVTWRIHSSQVDLGGEERTVIVRTLQHFHGEHYSLMAFVVMNDHVHVLVTPGESRRLEETLRGWKSFTSHRMTREFGRKAPVWQAESYDRIVRDQAEFDEKLRYILNNPVKRWPDLVDYPWVGCLLDESWSRTTKATVPGEDGAEEGSG